MLSDLCEIQENEEHILERLNNCI